MKFLKTFLFTISFCFIFGSIMSLCGYCEAAPVLTPDPSSFQVIQGGSNDIYLGFQGLGQQVFMSEEFNTQFMNEVQDFFTDEYGNAISPTYDLMKGPYDGMDLQIAERISLELSKNALTYTQFVADNWDIISKSASEWGNNAKQYFIGKVDSATGTISNAIGNVLTYVSDVGLQRMLSATNTLKNNGTIHNISSNTPIRTDHLTYTFYNSDYNKNCTLNFNLPEEFVFYSVPVSGDSINSYLGCLVPVSYGRDVQLSNSVAIVDGQVSVISHFHMPNNKITINGISYYYGYCYPHVGNTTFSCLGKIFLGSLQQAESVAASSTNNSLASIIQVSPSYSSQLASLLNLLKGHWVDSDGLNRIQTIIREVPVVVETINNEPVPVAELSPEYLDEIRSVIIDILETSQLYDQLNLPEPDPEPDPNPDPVPDPDPSNQGTEVPEDFPTSIFSPINDSVGGVFDFVSIFEPLFYIFSFSTGLLGLWLVIPFVILFMFLFKLLK